MSRRSSSQFTSEPRIEDSILFEVNQQTLTQMNLTEHICRLEVSLMISSKWADIWETPSIRTRTTLASWEKLSKIKFRVWRMPLWYCRTMFGIRLLSSRIFLSQQSAARSRKSMRWSRKSAKLMQSNYQQKSSFLIFRLPSATVRLK